jgi:hypothetical protein
MLRTEKGDARLQKTDIFKKIMWFSYPREESWVPMPIAKVKEIQQQNREGIIPADLGEMVEIETKSAKILDYENVVGQDSLTRLDERRNTNQNQNRSKSKNNKSRNRSSRPDGAQAGPRPEGSQQSGQRAEGSNRQQQQQQQGPRPEGQQARPEGGNRPQGNRPEGGNRQQGQRPDGTPRPEGGNRPQGSNNNRRNNNRPRPNNPNRNDNPPPARPE